MGDEQLLSGSLNARKVLAEQYQTTATKHGTAGPGTAHVEVLDLARLHSGTILAEDLRGLRQGEERQNKLRRDGKLFDGRGQAYSGQLRQWLSQNAKTQDL